MAGRPTAPPAPEHRWEVEFTAEAGRWYTALDGEAKIRTDAALRRLQRGGPTLGRPTVDSIQGSRHHNMKELRVVGLNLRALFVFDPRQRAVVLVGGDKTADKRWYRRNVRRAEQLLDRHLRDIGKEVRCRPGSRSAGTRSADYSR